MAFTLISPFAEVSVSTREFSVRDSRMELNYSSPEDCVKLPLSVRLLRWFRQAKLRHGIVHSKRYIEFVPEYRYKRFRLFVLSIHRPCRGSTYPLYSSLGLR